MIFFFFFFSSRRRHTRWNCDWSSDVCSSDLISVPKGTPPEIIDILNRAVNEALKDPKLVARLAEIGGVPKPLTPEGYGRLIADETEKWRKVVAFAGVSVD